MASSAGDSPEVFVLNDQCPAGFARNAKNYCKLDSLYNNYQSPHGSGVGGLRAGLPALRDGFSPRVIDLGRYLFLIPSCQLTTPLPALVVTTLTMVLQTA